MEFNRSRTGIDSELAVAFSDETRAPLTDENHPGLFAARTVRCITLVLNDGSWQRLVEGSPRTARVIKVLRSEEKVTTATTPEHALFAVNVAKLLLMETERERERYQRNCSTQWNHGGVNYCKEVDLGDPLQWVPFV